MMDDVRCYLVVITYPPLGSWGCTRMDSCACTCIACVVACVGVMLVGDDVIECVLLVLC